MAGWTNLTPSAGTLAAGNAYLYESSGALKYQGTSGSALTLANADGTTPSAGWTLITSSTMSGAANINFSSIAQTYADLKIVVDGATSGTSSKVWLRMGNGSANTTSGAYSIITTDTQSATWSLSGVTNAIEIGGTSSLTRYQVFEIRSYAIALSHGVSAYHTNDTKSSFGYGSFSPSTSVAINYVSIQNSAAANWTGGTVYLYGRS